MTDAPDGEPAPAAITALLWRSSEDRAARPGPKPKLTLEQVVAAGIAIADEEGLDAVTMQRLADRLGAKKMALYRYVPGRAELDALLLDHGFDDPPSTDGAPWRSALTAWALALFDQALRHPWGVVLAQRNHVPGPRELLWFEAGLAPLATLPLHAAEKLDVLALLSGHVLSLVGRTTAAASPESDMRDALMPILAARSQDYPHTAETFANAADDGRDAGLSFGIERALDGIESLIARRGGGMMGR